MSETDKYKVKWTTRFKKDYKLAVKRGYNVDLLDDVIRLIAKGNQQQRLTDYLPPFTLVGVIACQGCFCFLSNGGINRYIVN